MNLAEFQEMSQRTMPDYSNVATKRDSICNYTIGLVSESGELAEHIKKHLFHCHDLSLEEVRKELGDVLHYLSGLATIFGISLEDVAITNIDKLKKRYPDGFNTEDSIARVDVVEGKA